MNIYKLELTTLQQGILSFLFLHAGASSTANALARHLEVSPAAISKALPALKDRDLIIVQKDKESRRLAIQMNRDNPRTKALKRVENLRLVYASGLAQELDIPGATVILFGSFAFGEDTVTSDIDIAVIPAKKIPNLDKYERILSRTINAQQYASLREVHKDLRESICNGIVLRGGIAL